MMGKYKFLEKMGANKIRGTRGFSVYDEIFKMFMFADDIILILLFPQWPWKLFNEIHKYKNGPTTQRDKNQTISIHIYML